MLRSVQFRKKMSIYICIVYVPSIDSNIHKTNDINVFECIESGIEKYKEHGYIYFVTRVNKDHVINAHGRRFVYFCKTTDLFIGNGRLDGDKYF